MRIGDVRKLAFDIDPVAPSWETKTPSERGPWGRLAIWVHGENLCRNVLPTTSDADDGVYVPLAPLADFFVRNAAAIAYQESAPVFPTDVDLPAALEEWKNAAPRRPYNHDLWDDLRFEWSEQHFLAAGSDGSWLPNLAFVKADAMLWISAAPPRFATPGAPTFLYQRGSRAVPWLEAISVISEFVALVGSRLRTLGLTMEFQWCVDESPIAAALKIDLSTYLSLNFRLSPEELKDSFHAGSIDEMRSILGLQDGLSPADSVTLQALRDLELSSDVVKIALRCDRETREPRSEDYLGRRLRAQEAAPASSPEDQGYAAARLMRQDLGIDLLPLSDPEDLIRRSFGIEVEDSLVETRSDHLVAGAHVDGFGKIVLLDSSQTRVSWARRMELFRGVGHLLLDAPTHRAIGAGSSSRAIGPRRRRSGTFAAEMLLPQEEIRRRSGGILDEAGRPEIFESLMADYGVGAQTVAWQCFNGGLLSSREVVDELIARHGHNETRAT